MRIAINAAVVDYQGRLLVVKKNNSWILPGGKPEQGEDEEACLHREFAEKLSGTKIVIRDFYKDFVGKTPHVGDLLKARVYICSIEGEPGAPSAEIKDKSWMSYEERTNYNLSDITAKIVEQIRADNRLTGF